MRSRPPWRACENEALPAHPASKSQDLGGNVVSRRRWIAILSLVVVVIAFLAWWRARNAAGAPKFRTAEIEQGSIESNVSATGTIQPVEQVEVGSQVSGTVYRIHADYNSRVQKGQVLCEIE